MLASSGLDCDYKRIAVERIVPRARLKDISIGNVELSKLEGLYMKKLIVILLILALLLRRRWQIPAIRCRITS